MNYPFLFQNLHPQPPSHLLTQGCEKIVTEFYVERRNAKLSLGVKTLKMQIYRRGKSGLSGNAKGKRFAWRDIVSETKLFHYGDRVLLEGVIYRPVITNLKSQCFVICGGGSRDSI